MIEDLYMLLPFAKAGNGGILHPVKSAFVHSANQLFSNIHGHYLAVSYPFLDSSFPSYPLF